VTATGRGEVVVGLPVRWLMIDNAGMTITKELGNIERRMRELT
jgi:hypothetical protein